MLERAMKTGVSLLLAAVVALAGLAVPVAASDIDLIRTGPAAGFIPHCKTFEDVKGEPLYESQWFGTTWAAYAVLPVFNTAGILFNLQYDGHEVSSLTLTPMGSLYLPGASSVYLPGSQSSPQSQFPISMWLPGATSSGTWVPASTLMGMFYVSGHVKNSATANNSDIDIDLDIWRIHHVAIPGPHYFEDSVYVYLTGTQSTAGWARQPGTGIWVHYSGGWTCSVPNSAFVATHCLIENVAGYGIEHVPEPLSVLIMLLGAGTMLTGRARRQGAR